MREGGREGDFTLVHSLMEHLVMVRKSCSQGHETARSR